MKIKNRIYNLVCGVKRLDGDYVNAGQNIFGRIVQYDWNETWGIKQQVPKFSSNDFATNYLESVVRTVPQIKTVEVLVPQGTVFANDPLETKLDITVYLNNGKIKKFDTYKKMRFYAGWLMAHPKSQVK